MRIHLADIDPLTAGKLKKLVGGVDHPLAQLDDLLLQPGQRQVQTVAQRTGPHPQAQCLARYREHQYQQHGAHVIQLRDRRGGFQDTALFVF